MQKEERQLVYRGAGMRVKLQADNTRNDDKIERAIQTSPTSVLPVSALNIELYNLNDKKPVIF